ncbi:hypothetical protein VTK73DRAFT_2453 [Phialemonium thermophilum]|uniref:Uncharacterized protein n=1 Tax=Phialemonium thermophilum TaxID=223376 RepID=A0ABR3X550_9PEZI
MCGRCLSSGIECRYSPSSRAGKPKSEICNNNNNNHSNHNNDDDDDGNYALTRHSYYNRTTPNAADQLSSLQVADDAAMPNPAYIPSPCNADIWPGDPSTNELAMSRIHSTACLNFLATDSLAYSNLDIGLMDTYEHCPEWLQPGVIPPAPESADLGDHLSSGHQRSQSYDNSIFTSITQWPVSSLQPEMSMWIQPQTQTAASSGSTTTLGDSPAFVPNFKLGTRQKSLSTGTIGTYDSCSCFGNCLSTLQSLYNNSPFDAPSLDALLSLNQKAVASCESILACGRCMRWSVPHTVVVVLATVMREILQSYKMALKSLIDKPDVSVEQMPTGGDTTLSFGDYQADGKYGRWVQQKILVHELEKLQLVFVRFKEMWEERSEDRMLSQPMIIYIEGALRETLETLGRHRDEL